MGYHSVGQLYDAYRGIRPINQEINEAMQRGIDNEDRALEELRRDHLKQWLFARPGLVFHPHYSWLACSPDALGMFNSTQGELVNIEIKVPLNGHKVGSKSELLQRHSGWVIQVLVQLECLQMQKAYLWIWNEDANLCSLFEIKPNQQLMHHILSVCDIFRKGTMNTEGNNRPSYNQQHWQSLKTSTHAYLQQTHIVSLF